VLKTLLLVMLVALILLGIGSTAAVFGIMRIYQVTFYEAVNKGAVTLGLVEKNQRVLEYAEKYVGKFELTAPQGAHPRLIQQENLSNWSGLLKVPFIEQQILSLKAAKAGFKFKCPANNLSDALYCYYTDPSQTSLNTLQSRLDQFNFEQPKEVGEYGNGWQFALLFDLAQGSAQMGSEQVSVSDHKISQMLNAYLRNLDGDSASLWHGRASLAANAIILAATLNYDDTNVAKQVLLERAFGHFNQVFLALQTTEIWPSGYNYWINSRGFEIVLALRAFQTLHTDKDQQKSIGKLIRRIGLWHIYNVRPDMKVQGWGDEGPRVDLKDETAKVIDLIALLTQDPVFSSYSATLRHKFGSASYYPSYRWLLPLLFDPDASFIAKIDVQEATDLSALEHLLPNSELFGKGAVNQLIIRSGWRADDTFINFRAGHSFTHHQHYDAGHFGIFKGGVLAANSSTYAGMQSKNRLNYSIRTIAKNSLLIQNPNEEVLPNRHFEENVVDGGQRLTMPTGSALRSMQHWQQELFSGRNLQGASLIDYQFKPGESTSISADLTSAYNSIRYAEQGQTGKVRSVQRSLVYIDELDSLLVFDTIQATSAYKTKWLLHSMNKPQIDDLQVLKGQQFDGILSSKSNIFVIQEQQSNLYGTVLMPNKLANQIIGGPGYRAYVETDGDDNVLDGESFFSGNKTSPWFDNSLWRLELSPERQTTNTQYLVLLQPTLADELPTAMLKPDSTIGISAAIMGNYLFLWDYASGECLVKLAQQIKHVIVFSAEKSGNCRLQSSVGGSDINFSRGMEQFDLDLVVGY
jgi:hypothetical protein